MPAIEIYNKDYLTSKILPLFYIINWTYYFTLGIQSKEIQFTTMSFYVIGKRKDLLY